MSIEAMKQALEALEMLAKWEHPASNITTKTGRIYPHRVAVDAADTLRTAIEQAEKQDGDCQQCGGQGCVACDARKQEQFGPQEILQMIVDRALEKPAAPVQEPIGYADFHISSIFDLPIGFPLYTTPPAAPVQERNFCERCGKRLNDGRIHTCTPPETQRQWIGLTEEEHTQIAVDAGCMSSDWVFYGAAVERALKEKNK
jgi:hypothetical protein